MAQPFRASLDAVAGTVPITAVQSATIVSEISSKLERWLDRSHPVTVVVPSMRDVSILQGGSVWWCRGQAVPAPRAVAALGALLAALLDHTAAHRAPAGLLYVVARATDPRHLAPFADLTDFRRALVRYAASRPNVALDSLAARFAVACSKLPPLGTDSTISDVRRLRRAGGVTLAQIAIDTAIPISLLRELEWGVYTYWSLEHARGALELYAERAGLDGEAVARIVEQEQALVISDRVQPNLLSGRTTAKTLSVEHGVVPFALAALLTATVFLAAQADPPPRPTPARAAVSLAPKPDQPLPVSAADRPATGGLEQQLTPTAPRRPRGNRTAGTPLTERPATALTGRPATALSREPSAAPGPRTPNESEARRPAHPLAKLARAIAGDGRYRVEPFPSIKNE